MAIRHCYQLLALLWHSKTIKSFCMLTFWNKNVQLFQIITPGGNSKRYAARKKILQEDNFNSSIIKGKKVNRPCQTSLVSVSNFEKNKDFLMDFLFQYTDRREEDERDSLLLTTTWYANWGFFEHFIFDMLAQNGNYCLILEKCG